MGSPTQAPYASGTAGAAGAAAPVPELAPGEVLLGQFEIRKVLGRGGGGTVYLAHHLVLGEDVALKAVGTFGQSTRLVQVLGSEYKAQRKVQDRTHVLNSELPLACAHQGLDWVLLPMELAEQSLRDWLEATKDQGAERLETGLDLLRQACKGIAAIHEAGLVHMDVKPENLLLVKDPNGPKDKPKWIVKVADFGLSRGMAALAETRPELFGDGVGTPAYMAPEQVQAAHWRDVGTAADIYGLGMILFELLDGDLPYSGSADSIRQKKLNREIRIRKADGPAYLSDVAMACLEREAKARPGSAQELVLLCLNDAGTALKDVRRRLEEAAEKQRQKRTQGRNINVLNILLVDDNPSIHSITGTMLHDSNITLVCVDSASDAIIKLESSEIFDAILIDITIRDGMGLLDKMCKDPATRFIPILLMTGISDLIDPQIYANANIYGIINKPKGFIGLGQRLWDVVEKHRRETVVASPPAKSLISTCRCCNEPLQKGWTACPTCETPVIG